MDRLVSRKKRRLCITALFTGSRRPPRRTAPHRLTTAACTSVSLPAPDLALFYTFQAGRVAPIHPIHPAASLTTSPQELHRQNETRASRSSSLFWRENKTGAVRILIIFQDKLCLTISFERFRRELYSINVAELMSISKNRGVKRISVIFQDIPMLSHIIQRISARAFHGCG